MLKLFERSLKDLKQPCSYFCLNKILQYLIQDHRRILQYTVFLVRFFPKSFQDLNKILKIVTCILVKTRPITSS